MTLEEAKEALNSRVACGKINLSKLGKDTPKELLEYEKRQRILEIDETILNYIENESIPKEKVRNLRQKYEPAMKHYDCDEASYSQSQNVGAYMVLTRMLGE